MENEQPVADPAKERIRRAIVYFRDEEARLEERLHQREQVLDALLVVRVHGGAVSDIDVANAREAVREAREEWNLCWKRQRSLPAACGTCRGEGTDAKTGSVCPACKGIGF